jgi:hypothetical protein
VYNLEKNSFLKWFPNLITVNVNHSYYCANLVFFFQVDTILDKENFTLEELLDEDEIIQECKALNSRLINL